MPPSFSRVAPVAKGDPITSTQINALANARNERWDLGPGDCHWREAKWHENYWRQMRNPDADGFTFPLQGEYWYLPGLIDPSTGTEFPSGAGPGEPTGANLANPANQFVFGNPIMASEDERLSEQFPLEPPTDLTAIWNAGKAQRGAITAEGDQFTPALAAALSWLDIQTPYYSPQGKTFGGWFPSPTRLLDSCDSDPDSVYYRVPSVEIKFTNTVTGAIVTYPGTCPHGSEFGGAGQVLFNVYTPVATYVAVDNGDGTFHFDVYATSVWIEGPYESAPTLAHGPGMHTERAIWQFIKDFRGDAEQREDDTYTIENIAFSFQEFLTRPYPLAPNFGVSDGSVINEIYPTARINANAEEDSFLPFVGVGGGSTSFSFQPGYVCGGMFAAALNLAVPCTLNVLDESDSIIGSLTLPAGTGRTEAMLWLTNTVTPKTIRVQLATVAEFGVDGGSLGFEATQLYPYLPQYYDAYLVLRESATRGGFDDGEGAVDGSGIDQSDSKEIYDSLASNGCVINRHGALGPTEIGDSITINPVYDAARRMALNCRIIIDDQFAGYEVDGDGNSILTMKRYAYGDSQADVFQGIAPSYLPLDYNATLTAGETYICRGTGTIYYRGTYYVDGDKFTANPDSLGFIQDPDHVHYTIRLYVYEGIRTVAFPKGTTNEWNISFEFHGSNWSESSIWKESAYAKYFTGISKAHFWSTMPTNSPLASHINFTPRPIVEASDSDPSTFVTSLTPETNQASFYNPEAPSGYGFAQNTNGPEDHGSNDIAFYKSNQIYTAPYKVTSATVRVVAGNEFVVLKLAGRLRSHESAPATVSSDVSSWSDAEIFSLRVTEDYRTDDNAMREFFYYRVMGTQPTFKIGDSAKSFDSVPVNELDDAPFGCAIPKGFMIKGIEKFPEDGNDTQELTDTRCTMDVMNRLDLSVQVGCEGFVDGLTTRSLACRTGLGGLYDYSYRSLIFEATGRAQNSPLAITDRTDAAGFSVLPNTVIMAQQYNDLAACFNLLTRVRIMVPWNAESKVDPYASTQYVTPDIAAPSVCADGSDSFFAWTGAPDAPAAGTPGAWGPAGGSFAGNSSADFGTGPWCNPGIGYAFSTSKNVCSFRTNPIDPNSLYAIPALLQDLLINGGSGLLAQYDETSFVTRIKGVSAGSQTMCDSMGAVDGANYYEVYTEETVEADAECRLISAGTLDPGTAPGGTFTLIHDASSGGKCASGSGRLQQITIIGTEDSFFFEIPLV